MKKKQKGASLLLVIATTGVLMILCASLSSAMVFENRHAAKQEKRTQAYFIAKAGAEAAIKELSDIDAIDINGQSATITSEDNVFANGTFDVTITRNPNNRVISVTSVAKVKNANPDGTDNYVTDAVTAVMSTLNSPQYALYGITGAVMSGGGIVEGTNGSVGIGPGATLDLTNSSFPITGDIVIPATSDKNTAITGNDYLTNPAKDKAVPTSKIPTYKPKKIPVFPNLGIDQPAPIGTIPDYSTGKLKDAVTITADGSYDNIIMNQDGSRLVIDTGTDTNTVRKIRIKQLTISSGIITITGAGKVELYVDNWDGNLDQPMINGVPSSDPTKPVGAAGATNGDSSKLTLYCNSTSNITLGSVARVNATVYLNSPNIFMGGGSYINGSLYACSTDPNATITFDGAMKVTSDIQTIYAPTATVNITAGTKINGAVIAKKANVVNGGTIKYDQTDADKALIDLDNYGIKYWQ